MPLPLKEAKVLTAASLEADPGTRSVADGWRENSIFDVRSSSSPARVVFLRCVAALIQTGSADGRPAG